MSLDAVNKISVQELRRMQVAGSRASCKPAKKRRNKFGARPVWYDSPTVGQRRFASQKEADRAGELDLLVKGGDVVAWWHEWPVDCGVTNDDGTPVVMKVDFRILWRDGSVSWEDTKGAKPTADWTLKRKMVRDLHGVVVKVI